MNIDYLAGRLGRFLNDNSPTILTGIAAAGVVTTAYLTGRASFKAARVLSEESPHLETREKMRLCGKLYIPAAGAGLVTIAAIIGANRIGERRVAAMATAVALSERAFEAYREKVVEKVGRGKEQAVKDEIAQDHVTNHPPVTREIIMTDGGEVLCCEGYTGRYFKSSMEALKQAQNALNYRVLHDGYASLTELYHLIGLRPTSHSDLVGWNTDKPLELDFSTALTDEGKPCLYLRFYVEPKTNFDLSY